MNYDSVTNNLDNLINNLKQKISENEDSSISEVISCYAYELGLDIEKFSESIYIKKGGSPKAIIHLNIDPIINKSLYLNFKIDDKKIYEESSYINIFTSSLLIILLLKYSQEDFDILLTNNSTDNKEIDYKILSNTIRSNNIINLNLRQADCIADEFSAMQLYLNQLKVDRFDPSYEYKTYRLSVENLKGGHQGEGDMNVKISSIKLIIGLIRRIKSKVDLDIISISGGNKYTNIASSSNIEFIIKSDYENELLNIYKIVKNETIEKNLRYEPDMIINLEEIESQTKKPMTNDSFDHLASFIELTPQGSYSVNSLDNQTISSSNLSTIRTVKDTINMILVFRSLSSESMKQMIDTTYLASKISKSFISKKLEIDKWKNESKYLTNIFEQSYFKLNERELKVIKTQYSLDASLIFKDMNVNIISLGVKYKQDEGVFYSSVKDLIDSLILVNNSIRDI